MTETPGWKSIRLLVVDDEEGMRTLLSRMLGRMMVGHVTTAASAEHALNLIESATDGIDAIICDWNMPGMSGMELFERTRSARPDVPYLMITGRADIESVIAAKKAGISGYLVKPVSYQELQKKLSFLIKNHKPTNSSIRPAANMRLES